MLDISELEYSIDQRLSQSETFTNYLKNYERLYHEMTFSARDLERFNDYRSEEGVFHDEDILLLPGGDALY